MAELSHFDAKGDAHMVDVSDKAVTDRIARAECYIKMAPETFDIIKEGRAKKGDVTGVARLAGIMGAKRTADLIPLCHPLALDHAAVEITLEADGVRIEAETRITARTGVEMEALTAVSVAALTLVDMVKALGHDAVITDVRVERKEGGRSGVWERVKTDVQLG